MASCTLSAFACDLTKKKPRAQDIASHIVCTERYLNRIGNVEDNEEAQDEKHITTVQKAWKTYQQELLQPTTLPLFNLETLGQSVAITQGAASIALERPLHLVPQDIVNTRDITRAKQHIRKAISNTPSDAKEERTLESSDIRAQQLRSLAYIMYNMRHIHRWTQPIHIMNIIEQQPHEHDIRDVERKRYEANRVTSNALEKLRHYMHPKESNSETGVLTGYENRAEKMLNSALKPHQLQREHDLVQEKTRKLATHIYGESLCFARCTYNGNLPICDPYSEFQPITRIYQYNRIDLQSLVIPALPHQKPGVYDMCSLQ